MSNGYPDVFRRTVARVGVRGVYYCMSYCSVYVGHLVLCVVSIAYDLFSNILSRDTRVSITSARLLLEVSVILVCL